jgi:hypothetical protein
LLLLCCSAASILPVYVNPRFITNPKCPMFFLVESCCRVFLLSGLSRQTTHEELSGNNQPVGKMSFVHALPCCHRWYRYLYLLSILLCPIMLWQRSSTYQEKRIENLTFILM